MLGHDLHHHDLLARPPGLRLVHELRLLRGAAGIGGERLRDGVNDHHTLRDLPGKPRHPVYRAADERNPAVRAVHLDRDRPAWRQAVGPEVRIGARSRHRLHATAVAGRRKPQIGR
jgi:hypothetical protein